MMPNAIYPGSFDPITLGHIDIIRRIQPIFGEITLLISQHSAKKYLFTVEERKALAERALTGIPGIKVEIHDGLTIDFARDAGAQVIVRGLRAVGDFEYELVMANMNKKLAPAIETMIVFASPEFYYVSSHTVKEVAMNGGKVSDLVPANVDLALKSKFADRVEELRSKRASNRASNRKRSVSTKRSSRPQRGAVEKRSAGATQSRSEDPAAKRPPGSQLTRKPHQTRSTRHQIKFTDPGTGVPHAAAHRRKK